MEPREPPDEPTLYRYGFGCAEFDEARAELRVDGTVVELEQRPLQVLACLLHHADEVVGREELFQSVWAGRPTVDNVLANAVAKLRKALGPGEARRIVTVPRVGYRLAARSNGAPPAAACAVGLRWRAVSRYRDASISGCASSWVRRSGNEVWLARHDKTGERRVYKFCSDGERLAGLKHEATICRLLRESLGERDDFVRVIDWNFESEPFYLECEYGGLDLARWAEQEPGLAALDLDQRLRLFRAGGAGGRCGAWRRRAAQGHQAGQHPDARPCRRLATPLGRLRQQSPARAGSPARTGHHRAGHDGDPGDLRRQAVPRRCIWRRNCSPVSRPRCRATSTRWGWCCTS